MQMKKGSSFFIAMILLFGIFIHSYLSSFYYGVQILEPAFDKNQFSPDYSSMLANNVSKVDDTRSFPFLSLDNQHVTINNSYAVAHIFDTIGDDYFSYNSRCI